MSNLVSYVLSFIFFIPTVLFGFDIYLLQARTSELEAYASYVVLSASDRGINDSHIVEAAQNGYTLYCTLGCEFPQIGQTQQFVLTTSFNPLFISKEKLTLKVERSYLIGYY